MADCRSPMSNHYRFSLRDSLIRTLPSFARSSGRCVSVRNKIRKAFPRSCWRPRSWSSSGRRYVWFHKFISSGMATDYALSRSKRKRQPKKRDDRKNRNAHANGNYKTSDRRNALSATEAEAEEEVAVVVVVETSIDAGHRRGDRVVIVSVTRPRGANSIRTSHLARAEVVGRQGQQAVLRREVRPRPDHRRLVDVVAPAATLYPRTGGVAGGHPDAVRRVPLAAVIRRARAPPDETARDNDPFLRAIHHDHLRPGVVDGGEVLPCQCRDLGDRKGKTTDGGSCRLIIQEHIEE